MAARNGPPAEPLTQVDLHEDPGVRCARRDRDADAGASRVNVHPANPDDEAPRLAHVGTGRCAIVAGRFGVDECLPGSVRGRSRAGDRGEGGSAQIPLDPDALRRVGSAAAELDAGTDRDRCGGQGPQDHTAHVDLSDDARMDRAVIAIRAGLVEPELEMTAGDHVAGVEETGIGCHRMRALADVRPEHGLSRQDVELRRAVGGELHAHLLRSRRGPRRRREQHGRGGGGGGDARRELHRDTR